MITRRKALRCGLDPAAARAAALELRSDGYRIGFDFVDAEGQTLAAVAPNTRNFGASITKAMLLVAFLRDSSRTELTALDRDELTAMIEWSDNGAADWVYAHLKSPAADVESIASQAGMTSFRLDVSDPVYILGQSVVSARDFARFFSRIETFMPLEHRRFGMHLLAGVEERVGLLAAGLPGVVYSKEGWKPENPGALGAPYIVNQAARFSCGGAIYGIGVTVGGAPDQADAQTLVQRIATALTGSRRR